MKLTAFFWPGAVLLLAAHTAGAAEAPGENGASIYPAVTGASHYVEYCAVCHGSEGGGDGPLAPGLTVTPPDLRTLTALNGGVFPADRIRRVIDGRDLPLLHGSRDMPVWGQVFKRTQGAHGERRVQERIDVLVDYLETLQQP